MSSLLVGYRLEDFAARPRRELFEPDAGFDDDALPYFRFIVDPAGPFRH
jgi:hypothetical protein